MIESINRLLKPLRNRVANMVSRAVVQLVDDSVKMQLLQLGLLDTETRDGIERFQNYGFTSNPLAGAEAAVLFVGGSRDHGLVLAVDDRRYRIRNLESGEVAVYTDQGDSIVFKRGGTVQITASTAIELGGNAHPVAQGDTLNIALNTLGAALITYATAIQPIADPSRAGLTALTTAVGAFGTSAAAALSPKVKL